MINTFFQNILIKPISTEKSVQTLENNRSFIFKVNIKSNKKQIKKVVEKLFDVSVKKVRTLIIKGNKTKFRQISGKKSDWKKAFVYLAEGSEINLSSFK